ncbi:MAG: hypothetical protein ACRDT4_05150 [Micromonosporaceae bacterium]
MKRLYLDTSKVTFMVTKPASEKSDGSGNQKRTKDGVPMWTVELLAQQEEGGVVINLSVAGEKPSVKSGQVVALEGLEVIPWNQNGRHGNAFRATAIRPTAAAKAAA